MPQMQRQKKPVRPQQKQQRQPGLEDLMTPRPEAHIKHSPQKLKLAGRVAVISGGDSGIGRTVAYAFASEGADICILHLKVQASGSDVPMGHTGQPNEVAPCYVFLASDDSSYMTGQVLHPNGGEIVNG